MASLLGPTNLDMHPVMLHSPILPTGGSRVAEATVKREGPASVGDVVKGDRRTTFPLLNHGTNHFHYYWVTIWGGGILRGHHHMHVVVLLRLFTMYYHAVTKS